MENMEEFLKQLSGFDEEYKKEEDKKQFNIFNALFDGQEEVTLHSRFISYLLSSNSVFLKLFVRNILKIKTEDFDTNNCEVYPNEHNKSEKWEIDILIINKEKKQAIIIENKIHANDTIHKNAKHKGNSYEGQLERYYHTITTGFYKRGGKYIELEDKSFICDKDKTYVYYLSLYKNPTDETIGELKEKGIFNSKEHIIDYYQIQEWLDSCIIAENKSYLKESIKQYLNLIIEMTTNNEKALKVTNLIAENENHWQSAYIFSEHLKNIKWHTVHRFFTELTKRISAKMPDERLITDATHKNKKVQFIITFEYKGTKLQIENDEQGFTLGKVDGNKDAWRKTSFLNEEIKNIKFNDFSNKETFHIINNDYRNEIIQKIIDEIDKHHKENYKNLNKPFKKTQ